MTRPVIVIPAPIGPVTPNVTGWCIGFLGALSAFGGPASIVWLARINGWL